MPFHESYHLILSAPETRRILEDTKSPHLSLEYSASTTHRKNAREVRQVPEWVYHKKNGVDQVKLEVPGISMDDLVVFASNREIVVSAIRFKCTGNTRKVHCEYHFKMRLADNNDQDAITWKYRDGVLSINIPRIEKKVKKLVPAFLYNKNSDRDEIILELVGVKRGDVKYDIKDGIITIIAVRYDESDDVKIVEAEYFLAIKAGPNNDLKKIHGDINAGIFKLCLPRKPEKVREIVPVHFHKKEPKLDIVVIELPGSKDDIEIKAVRERLHVHTKKYDGADDGLVLNGVYSFYMDFPRNTDFKEMKSKFDDGILTLSIPRQ